MIALRLAPEEEDAMSRRAQTERRINGIAVMFAPLVMAAKEREAQEKKRTKAERDAAAKREKRKAAKEQIVKVCSPGCNCESENDNA